ncbi:putative EF-hand domain-containing protein [Plasmopara halstedii]
MSRHGPPISTQNAQNNVETKLYDFHAFTKLSSCHEDRQPSPASLSLSMKLPSRQELVSKRPSSAQEFRQNDRIQREDHRGILKETATHSLLGRERQSESPNQWFQRIMRERNLSPLDLCEKFSTGDVGRKPLVSFENVCEVLYNLDPEPANGLDPVTEEMEVLSLCKQMVLKIVSCIIVLMNIQDFLYQFTTEQGGEIMVNIRDALRSLDIWRTRPSVISKVSLEPHFKFDKRKLQNTNLRSSSQSNYVHHVTSPKSVDRLTKTSRRQADIKSTKDQILPATDNPNVATTTVIKNDTVSSSISQFVNDHEQGLVEIASRLQFAGVKQLENLLIENDAEMTGFVSLKQLCWLLTDQFELKINERRLSEICMGLNFDTKAQLDYKDFINVLMDILIYAQPDIRESVKKKSLTCLDEYLKNGFPPTSEKAHLLIDNLCSKYDFRGDQCILLLDLIRVFQKKLVKYHALKLPFPLEKHEIIQLSQPFIHRHVDDTFLGDCVAYHQLLDAIFGGSLLASQLIETEHTNRALNWDFWRNLHMTLCGWDIRLEKKVRAQLERIMARLDPGKSYAISYKNFERIFSRHLTADDMKVLQAALAVPNDGKAGSSLRYDMLLSMVFGSFELNDNKFLKHIRVKLLPEREKIESFINAIEKKSDKLSLQDFHDAFMVQNNANRLTLAEMLFLFASLESKKNGKVRVEALITFLERNCRFDRKRYERDTNMTARPPNTHDLKYLRKIIAECCQRYDLSRKLDKVSRKTQGWISHKDLVKELSKMLHEAGAVDVDRFDLHDFVKSIVHRSSHISGNAPTFCLQNVINCDAFFDALFDWDAMVSSMRLPYSIVEANEVFKKFDKLHDGTIRSEDWNKAYHLISRHDRELQKWELCVLERMFSREQYEHTIDYARFVVYLLDYQQRQARKALQIRVLKHFQRLFRLEKSRAGIEKLFREIDVDNKGYFDTADLKTYMMKIFARKSKFGFPDDGCIALLRSVDAVTPVVTFLAETKLVHFHDCSPTSDNSQVVVTFERFWEIAHLIHADD